MHIKELLASETWALRHEVLWPNMPFEYVKVANDNTGFHYGLFIGDTLVSVISLFIDNEKAQFRKFATKTNFQRKGYGSQLLKYTLSKAAESSEVTTVFCNARKDSKLFYERFGMRVTDDTYLKGGVEFVVMELHF